MPRKNGPTCNRASGSAVNQTLQRRRVDDVRRRIGAGTLHPLRGDPRETAALQRSAREMGCKSRAASRIRHGQPLSWLTPQQKHMSTQRQQFLWVVSPQLSACIRNRNFRISRNSRSPPPPLPAAAAYAALAWYFWPSTPKRAG